MESNQIKVKCWRENKNIPLPKYAKDGDACCDLYAQSIEYDEQLDRYIVHTGLHIALDKGYEAQVRPRSSLTKTEFYIANTPGIIDSGYRGEILVVFKSRTAANIIRCIGYIADAIHPFIKSIQSDAYNNFINAHGIYRDIERLNEFPFKVGDRIAQLAIQKIYTIEWDKVDNLKDLGETERGINGYGSSGK